MMNFESEGRNLESVTPTQGPIPGGNERERLKITSGGLLVIDQFMLANQQFIHALVQTWDETLTATNPATTDVIQRFGGRLVLLSVGIYAVYRNAQERFMVVYPCQEGTGAEIVSPYTDRASLPSIESSQSVLIDTRAVVFVDIEAIRSPETRKEFLQLWQSAKRKEARDFLRTQGAAVRYGFSHFSDALELCKTPIHDVLVLQPAQ